MRFLELFCCRLGEAESTSDASSTAPTDLPPRRAAARQKRRHGAPQQWRPSLGAISEDGALRAAGGGGAGARVAPAPAPGKPKKAAAPAAVAGPRSWGSRELAMQAAIPALAPTPFMF